MKSLKLMSFMLAVLFVLSAVACTGGGGGTETSESNPIGSSDVSDTEEPLTDEEKYLASIPDVDYDGATVTILVGREFIDYFTVEKGENVIDEAVIDRNWEVEEKFGVSLEYVDMLSSYNYAGDFQNAVRESAYAGDATYDIVIPQSYYGSPLALEGAYYNMNNSPYLHLDEEWWFQNINKNNNVSGKLYGAAGIFSMDKITHTAGVLFNVDLMKDYNLGKREDIYNSVYDRTWTFEKFDGMAKNISEDLDKNELYDENDLYGVAMDPHGPRILIAGMDNPITNLTDDGCEIVYMTDKFVNCMNTIIDYCNSRTYVFHDYSSSAVPQAVFMAGRSLFCITRTGVVTHPGFRDGISCNYGIAPIPMYDDKQEDYVSSSMSWYIMYIPKNTEDIDRTCIILEALNYYTNKYVYPAFWQTSVHNKFVPDPEDFNMMTIARDCLYNDFTEFFQTETGQIYNWAAVQAKNNNTDFVSNYAASIDSWNQKTHTLIASYKILQ